MIQLEVTCAIMVRGNNILACQRGAHTEHPMEWEFPGGKIDTGENAENCIVREIREELDIEVAVVKALLPVIHDYGFKKIRLIPFLCEIITGEPRALEHESICWQPIDRFYELKWSAADAELFNINKAAIR